MSEVAEAANGQETDSLTVRRDRGRPLVGRPWFVLSIAIGVLFLAVASLVSSLYTGSALNALVRENARMVRASSTPLLGFASGNVSEDDGSPQLSFTVANSGTGPARVVWFQIRNNGAAHGTLAALAHSAGAPLVQTQHLSSTLVDTLIRPGEEREIVKWNRPAASEGPVLAAWEAVERTRFDYEVEACYCSLLGDCWQSTLDGDVPRPVARCEPEGRPSFGNTRLLRRVSGQRPE